MNVLVCGGAGYIGSHMAKMLSMHGYEPIVFDNLSTGYRWAVQWGRFFEGDLLNPADLEAVFSEYPPGAVMHFSACSLVGESVRDPARYYRNNVAGTLNLLEAMRQHTVDNLIFSSTAAIFGNPLAELIDEQHPKQPINPYGWSKLMVERLLEDYAVAYGLNSVALRYFNAAGADPEGMIGEAHNPETHLIPNVLRAVRVSKPLQVFGSDYPTPDGTCVRDYIHVNDLCRAHLLALAYLERNRGAFAFNLGNGKGFSVLDILNASEKIIGGKVSFQFADRRDGDPPTLVADSNLAQKKLGWQPEYSDIHNIIETAWSWEQIKQ